MSPAPAAKPVAPLFRRKRAYVAVAVGLLCLLWGAVEMWRGLSARRSLQTGEARIGFSEPVTFGPAGDLRYRVQVELTYSVGGQRYLLPISIPEVIHTREALADQLRQYRSGATIPILYDASRPSEIELSTGRASGFYLKPLALLAAGLVSLTFVFVLAATDGRYHCVACGTGVAELHAFCYMCGERIPQRKGKMAS